MDAKQRKYEQWTEIQKKKKMFARIDGEKQLTVGFFSRAHRRTGPSRSTRKKECDNRTETKHTQLVTII